MEANVSKTDKSLKSFVESLVQSKDVSELVKNLDLTLEQAKAVFDFIKEFKEDIHTIIKSLQEESKEVLSANNMALKTYLEELKSARSFEEKQAWLEMSEKVRKDMNKMLLHKRVAIVAGLMVIGGVIVGLSNSNRKSSLGTNIK
ncbi:hypothetical protein [Prevotella intermedia]|jgi:hypothetical protein|uniref:Uncharacterized protein n=1 Tax=Prevotella intermedia TaxID=28131 RepID=A0A2G9IDV5_PREIN|nr:hypothetical protein [Prevotella intermedia]PIN27954.1 hypothetical protein CUC04_00155 [Prevotella intermedia]